MAIQDVCAIRIAPNKGLIGQRSEHANADVFAQRKQALRLWKGQAQPWHFAILRLDSPQELRSRRKIPAFAMAVIRLFRWDP
jgi:hypothetical protein